MVENVGNEEIHYNL